MIQDAHLDKFNDFYYYFGYRSVFKEIRERHIDKDKKLNSQKQKQIQKQKQKQKYQKYQKRNKALPKIKTSNKSSAIYDNINNENNENNDKQKSDVIEEDPLSDYIKQKTISHMGFIVEAVVEAIPQV